MSKKSAQLGRLIKRDRGTFHRFTLPVQNHFDELAKTLARLPSAGERRPACRAQTGLRGQVLWYGSDGLDGTVPGRPKGPDSGAEVSLGVVRCHLGGPEGGTSLVGPQGPPGDT